jgi:hypothetical protein
MGDANKYWIDLNGVIGLQQKLLNVIKTDAAPGDAAVVGEINQTLAGVANSLQTANSSINPTLTYQQEVNDILQRENRRLTTRKNAIDVAYEGQKRMVFLTDSITAKNQAYNYMLFVLVLTLLAFVGIKFLHSFEQIPPTLLDILSIVIISLGLIYCIYLYMDIQRRYNMNFNQITLAEPVKKTPEETQKDMEKNIKAGNLYGLTKSTNTASGCQGSKCCPTDTTFNEKYSVCVPDKVPFDTPGLTVATKDNYKYFAAVGANGDVTYEWRNASQAKPVGCDTRTSSQIAGNVPTNGLANYDSIILGCKPVTSGFTTMSGCSNVAKQQTLFQSSNVHGSSNVAKQQTLFQSSADAKPFSASEFADYSRV